MNIASLFVELGLTGGNKSKKELKGVKDEMIGVSKKGLAAITAIAGVSYGFKLLYDNALRTGTSLSKFSSYTGMSTEQLQRWQYAARQSNVAADEITNSIQNVQQTIAQMKMSGQFTTEFQRFADAVNLDFSKLDDTFYVMQKLKDFAKSDIFPTDIENQILGAFVSPDVTQFLRDTKVDIDKIGKGNLLSNGQIGALKQLDVATKNLQGKLEISFSKVLAEVGPELVKKLDALIPVITQLTRAVLLSIGNFAEFMADPGGQIKSVGGGLMDPLLYKQLAEDLFPWTTSKIREGFKNPDIGLQERLAADIVRMKNGEASNLNAPVINQTFNMGGNQTKDNAAAVGKQAQQGTERGIQNVQRNTVTKAN